MKQTLKTFAKSIYFDILGVVLVVGIAIYSGYLGTNLAKYVDWGPITPYIPFGLISVINVGLSMLSTRLTGRIDNWGNIYGIVNVALSGTIDYILGNKTAYITYPITFIIYLLAIRYWNDTTEGKAETKSLSYKLYAGTLITAGAFGVAYFINGTAYDWNMNLLAHVTTITFALSLVANGFNAMKLTVQYPFWFVYNFVQLAKAFIQGNFANVGKYIFYIINSIGSGFIWGDSETEEPTENA